MDGRQLWIDAIRVVAAQLIVLHHLSIYGPVGETLRAIAPAVIDWLDVYGRIAVQVFLVIGGLLCAHGASRLARASARDLITTLGRRYLRLFVPLYGALALVLLAAIPGRAWIGADWVPHWPDWPGLLVHMLGLQDYLGLEALSAGAWYVAIDFQLHALVLGLVWLSARLAPREQLRSEALPVLVVLLAATSLVWVNRHPGWDFQPLYFFGSFALGFAAGWLGAREASFGERLAALAIVGLAVLALALEWRLRIAVALVCAGILVAGLRGRGARIDAWLRGSSAGCGLFRRWLVRLADVSYPLFLVHFSLCIVGNAWFVRWSDQGSASAVLAFVAAWFASVPVAMLLHRWIEMPIAQRMRRRER